MREGLHWGTLGKGSLAVSFLGTEKGILVKRTARMILHLEQSLQLLLNIGDCLALYSLAFDFILGVQVVRRKG